jgi:hypothetical protein
MIYDAIPTFNAVFTERLRLMAQSLGKGGSVLHLPARGAQIDLHHQRD